MWCAANYSKRSEQVAGGVFLIGLAFLFMSGNFFPGILIVIGLAALSKEIAEGRDWRQPSGWMIPIGIGLVFAFGFSLPLLLIGIGLWMVFGKKHGGEWGDWWKDSDEKRKSKNDDSHIVGERFQA